MSRTVTAARLLELLNQEEEQASALLAALRGEHEALQQRAASAIEAALDLKTERLSAFEQSEVERRQLLAALRIADDRETIGAFFAAQGDHATALTQCWSRLLDLADKCHAQNQLNGTLVETQRRHVMRALDILRGAPDTPTYGPTGTTDRHGGSHSLAKA